MKTYKLAVVGATGVVGSTILRVLEEKNLPISEYVLFASKRSAGKTIVFRNQNYIIQELTEDSFNEGFDFAIFSAGSDTAKHFAPIAEKKGCTVVDNSSAFRMDPNIPLVVPEVNPNALSNHRGIIANPNCSTIQAVVALCPLEKHYGIKRIIYSTYQAVSGAGSKGIQDLEKGIHHHLELSDSYKLEKFPYPIFNNCLPHIDVFLDNGYTKEEEKMINETKKILSKPHLPITATTVRVPVFTSHSESINIEFENEFKLNELVDILKKAPGITVVDNPELLSYPMAINATGQDRVLVGRIRRDFSISNGINLWVVADNLRKGAASNAVQIVELLINNIKLKED